MIIKKEGPKKAVSWYLKTRVGMFLSLFIFLILFMVLLYTFAPLFDSFGIGAITSVIISIILSGLFLYYYNKKFVKEWKEKDKSSKIKKTPKTIATIFIISFIILAALSFTMESKIINTISKIVLGILFLGYIYFKFIKK